MNEYGDGSSISIGRVLVLSLIAFVGIGILLVGGDDGGGEDTGTIESEDTEDMDAEDSEGEGEGEGEGTGEGEDEQEEEDNLVRVPIASDSPILEPYEEDTNFSDPDFSDLNETHVERLVVEYTNKFRENNSLGNLTYSETLSEPARKHSENMSEENYLGHFNPAGEGVRERYIDECDALREGREEFEYSENAAIAWYKVVFESSLTGENVYARSEEGVADLLVDEWRASDIHRGNLLDERWETIGVGIAIDGNGTVFGTQAFCSVGG